MNIFIFSNFSFFDFFRLTGCAPFYGESYDDVVERNLKADLNYNFQEINLTLQDSTMDLLKSLLMKDPKKRISASQALKHEAFKNIDDKLNEEDDLEVADNNTMHHLKDFHDKYAKTQKLTFSPNFSSNHL